MAGAHAKAFARIAGVKLVGCVDIRLETAEAFAKDHQIPAAFDSFGAALQSIEFDAVTNCTPDGVHFETTMLAIRAGKHVFCEKPLATRFEDAAHMAIEAERAGLIHGINLTYRNVSALQAARALILSGRIGAVRHFEASYLQSWLTQPAWGDWRTDPTWLWRLSKQHGSLGVLGDIGIHIFDFTTFTVSDEVRTLTGQLATFAKASGNVIGAYTLDANDSFSATVTLGGGATGVVHASRFASGNLNALSLQVFGDRGALKLTNAGDLGTLEICEGDNLEVARWVPVPLAHVPTNYERFAAAVQENTPMEPDFHIGARLQAVLDGVFHSEAQGAKISL